MDTSNSSSWRSVVRGNVLMMGLVSLFTDFSSEMIYPLLPVFFTGLVPLGAAALYVGLMEGIGESAASLLKILAGRLSDKLGRRKALAVLGYGVSTLARPLMALACAGWHIVGLRLLDRVGKGIRTSPRDALISESADASQRGLAFSFHRAMDHAGAIGGSLAAVALIYALLGRGLWSGHGASASAEEMRALRIIFAIALLPGICAMAALVAKVKDVPAGPTPRSAPDPAPSGASGEKGVARLPRRFHFFVLTVTMFALGNSSDLFIVLYGKTKFQMGLLQVVGLWVVLHLAKIVFSVPGGMLSDRFGRRPLIVLGWIVYAASYMGFASVESESGFWLLICLYGLYYGMTEGVEKALVADFAPAPLRGTAFGIYHGAVGLAALPASLVFGVFWNALGPRVAFGIGAVLAGAAAALMIVLLSGRRRPQAESSHPPS